MQLMETGLFQEQSQDPSTRGLWEGTGSPRSEEPLHCSTLCKQARTVARGSSRQGELRGTTRQRQRSPSLVRETDR
jgi:hypothetical protein